MDIIDIAIAKSKSGTVQDGSLTESKFSDALKMSAINDYVTPEMFGAVGDGVTDDTKALQDMFDSGKDVYLPSKTYLTDGNDINTSIHISTNNATLKARTKHQECILHAKARIFTSGNINLAGDFKACNGLLLTNAGTSAIDNITVRECLIWGIYNYNSAGISINRITAGFCGSKITLTASRTSSTILSIENDLTADQIQTLNHALAFRAYVYDTSGFSNEYVAGSAFGFATGYNSEDKQLTILSYNYFTADYISKSCVLCVGGAIAIAGGVNGQNRIGMIASTSCAMTLGMYSTYGHAINCIYSQSDRLGVFVPAYNLGSYYASLTFEGLGSGHAFASNVYDYSIVGVQTTNYDNNFDSSYMVSLTNNSRPSTAPVLAKYQMRKHTPFYYVGAGRLDINEQTPDKIFVRPQNSFRLDLKDPYSADSSYNVWGIKTIHFMPPSLTTDNITISLSDTLKSNGYTIKNAVDGVLTFARPSQYFKAEIFMQRKVFIVFVTSMDVADNVTT